MLRFSVGAVGGGIVLLVAAIALEGFLRRLPWRVGGGLVQFCIAAGVGLVVSPIALVAARADLPYHRWLWSLSVVLYGWALFRVVHDIRNRPTVSSTCSLDES